MPRNMGLRWTMEEFQAYQKRLSGKIGSIQTVSSLSPPKFPQVSEHLPDLKVKKGTLDNLNKTERRFLGVLKGSGYQDIRVQEITLKLGPDLRYTPDMFTPSDSTFWEVKGAFVREDARAKLLAAVRAYSFWRFILAQWKDNSWTMTEIKP